MPPPDSEQLKALEQTRQRLVRLTQSLAALIQNINSSDPLPPWYVLCPLRPLLRAFVEWGDVNAAVGGHAYELTGWLLFFSPRRPLFPKAITLTAIRFNDSQFPVLPIRSLNYKPYSANQFFSPPAPGPPSTPRPPSSPTPSPPSLPTFPLLTPPPPSLPPPPPPPPAPSTPSSHTRRPPSPGAPKLAC